MIEPDGDLRNIIEVNGQQQLKRLVKNMKATLYFRINIVIAVNDWFWQLNPSSLKRIVVKEFPHPPRIDANGYTMLKTRSFLFALNVENSSIKYASILHSKEGEAKWRNLSDIMPLIEIGVYI